MKGKYGNEKDKSNPNKEKIFKIEELRTCN